MNKRIILSLLLIFVIANQLFGQVLQPKTFDPNYKLIFNNPTQDKNFYVLSMMQNLSDVRKALGKNRTLKNLAKLKSSQIKLGELCNNEVPCLTKTFQFSDEQIEMVAKAFENSANDKKLMMLVENHLRPSGMFIRYDSKSDAELLAFAWRDAAKGVNHILDVFGLGKDAKYKDIDNVSYDVNSAEYQKILKAKVAEIKLKKDALFFEPTLAFAMKLLEANGRDEAGRHEPYEKSVNQKAVENLKNIKWNDYPYSVILVLGSGPGNSGLSISKEGMTRSDEAVKLFQTKQAPLIFFSGGYVHPARTPYCEAIEMKKYVMQKYGIPEANILVEVQARHTTTNVRNAARIMFRDGIPTDKKGLITSSQTHIDYVAGEAFTKRFLDEIGFVPMKIFTRISPVAIEFVPLKDSLFVNSLETLDP
jgi:hypothetical protein